jgi:enamine deaminase RidA (YjgF/YER057c/UK114 family)
MAGKIEARLKQLGLSLPAAAIPVANYVPFVKTGNLVFVAGQIPLLNGAVHYHGVVGLDVTVEEAVNAARLCALNILAQVKTACDGDLDRVVRLVKLTGFVAANAHFTEHPKVINGASDLMVEVFGDAGRHARAAVGAPSLPRGVPVEVDAIFEVT